MIFLPLPRAVCLAALVACTVNLRAAEPEDAAAPTIGRILNPGSRSATPLVQPASDEAQQALQRMTLPPGLEVKVWAAEPMLANPVAFNFDERGRIFVAETHRYRTSVLDIRDYMWMLEDELANRNEADWMATLQRRFGPEGIRELSIESEVVRLLEDSKGTGVADFHREWRPADGRQRLRQRRRGAARACGGGRRQRLADRLPVRPSRPGRALDERAALATTP
jgi:hypothetical protein